MTTQGGYRVPNWLVALAGGVIFLLGMGLKGGLLVARAVQQHEFLVYETCRIERQLGMVTPQECDRGNHIQGEEQ